MTDTLFVYYRLYFLFTMFIQQYEFVCTLTSFTQNIFFSSYLKLALLLRMTIDVIRKIAAIANKMIQYQ